MIRFNTTEVRPIWLVYDEKDERSKRRKKYFKFFKWMGILGILIWLLLPIPFLIVYWKHNQQFEPFIENGALGLYSVQYKMKKGNKEIILIPLASHCEQQFYDEIANDIAQLGNATVLMGTKIIPIDMYSLMGVKLVHAEVVSRILRGQKDSQLENIKRMTEIMLNSPTFNVTSVVDTRTPVEVEFFAAEFKDLIKKASCFKLLDILDLEDTYGIHRYGLHMPSLRIHVEPPNHKISALAPDNMYFFLGSTKMESQNTNFQRYWDIDWIKIKFFAHIFYYSQLNQTGFKEDKKSIRIAVGTIDRLSHRTFVVPWDVGHMKSFHKELEMKGYHDVEQHRRLMVNIWRLYWNRLFWRILDFNRSWQLLKEEIEDDS